MTNARFDLDGSLRVNKVKHSPQEKEEKCPWGEASITKTVETHVEGKQVFYGLAGTCLGSLVFLYFLSWIPEGSGASINRTFQVVRII